MKTSRIYTAAIGIAAAVLTVGIGAFAAPPIAVTVNGSPITFTGTQPQEVSGSVLVPLRGVFEAMGASVNYNQYSRVIDARKGTSAVQIPLGATTATVNGQTQTLSQPAQVINGTTLVPLRFVAQALGGYVDWHAVTSTVEIRTQAPVAVQPNPSTPPPPITPLPAAETSDKGSLTSIYLETNPQRVAVRINGEDQLFTLTPKTTIQLQQSGETARAASLAALTPGEEVTVKHNDKGEALQITAAYGDVHAVVNYIGRVANGNAVITLKDGSKLEIAKTAIVIKNGHHTILHELKSGDKIAVATNPVTGVGFMVTVIPGL